MRTQELAKTVIAFGLKGIQKPNHSTRVRRTRSAACSNFARQHSNPVCDVKKTCNATPQRFVKTLIVCIMGDVLRMRTVVVDVCVMKADNV